MKKPSFSEIRQDDNFFKRLKSRKRSGRVFQSLTILSVIVGLLALGALLFNVMTNGRLLEALHGFAQTQQVTLSLRAVTQGAQVTTYIQVAKALYERNNLARLGTSFTWDAGAVSSQKITRWGGFAQTVVAETNTARAIGLSRNTKVNGLGDIDFAVVLGQNGRLAIYEGGTLAFTPPDGAYASADLIRVVVRGPQVFYEKNENVLFTSLQTLREEDFPLVVGTALRDPGATLMDVMVESEKGREPANWRKEIDVEAFGHLKGWRYRLNTGDVLISFMDTPLNRSGDLWRRMQAAGGDALEAAELRWVPRLERLFGDLDNKRGEDGRFVQAAKVLPGSPAERAGLQAGDVIRAVGGRSVERSAEVFEAILLEKLNDPSLAPVALLVERGGSEHTLALEAVASSQDRYDRNLLSALWYFLSHFDSRYPEVAGMVSAVFGSLYIILLTALFSFPVGIGAAIYLEEYATKGRLSNFISVNIANLAGVPSVVYGIIGLEVFARGAVLGDLSAWFGFPKFEGLGRTIIAGALTLALLILPIIIINAREALKAVPYSMREAAYGVGATRWQVVRHHVLPYALPGVFTGVILAMSRAIGETAPLLLLGAFLYVPFVPDSVFDVFTVMPIQIFSWTNQPQDGYPNLAAAAILVLLGVMLLLNAIAIVLRNRFQMRW